jgi:hypothetical protein
MVIAFAGTVAAMTIVASASIAKVASAGTRATNAKRASRASANRPALGEKSAVRANATPSKTAARRTAVSFIAADMDSVRTVAATTIVQVTSFVVWAFAPIAAIDSTARPVKTVSMEASASR